MGMLEDDLTEAHRAYNRRMEAVDAVLSDVRAEIERAIRKHRPMNSPHEAYAVIQEEVDELWDDVKADKGRESCARKEAIQIAAMGVRYATDIVPR